MRPLLRAALVAALATGARADDAAERVARTCTVETAGSTAALRPGEEGVVVLALRTDPGIHVQAQAPLRVTLAATPGLALARRRLGWEDVPDRAAPALRAAFTAREPGAQQVTARLEFFLCSATWCHRQEREVAVPVAVGEPAGGAPRPP